MKSEQARKYLQMSAMHPNSPLAQDQDYVWRDASIIKAVELAEQEAEEEITHYKTALEQSKQREELAQKIITDKRNEIEALKARAVSLHRRYCPKNCIECVHRDRDDYSCNHNCDYVKLFTQKLNER